MEKRELDSIVEDLAGISSNEGVFPLRVWTVWSEMSQDLFGI